MASSIPDDLSGQIGSMANSGIRRARGDSGEVEQMSMKDMIDADRYLAAKYCATNGINPVIRRRMVAPNVSGVNVPFRGVNNGWDGIWWY